ncbi:hypothetical protein [Chitinivibrio alkaliphilus]|uniref:Methyltransferase n=1 Tax=Chitinivibrio alkaliphilus ACht1 TaxID=1313304 RepID=U7D8U0_9BACT|nr:hypothetical protein [Chitinivibrio alkaliphilus]ERP31517.1 hypothetical protein CALK_1562 [Chitinivibrio alkaliphilus ACht1]
MGSLAAYLLLFATLFGAFSLIITTIRGDSPPLPTSCSVRREILQAIPSHSTRFVDLGSGWGGMVHAVQRHRPSMEVWGYEHSLLPYGISRLRTLLYRGVHLRFGSFFQHSIEEGDCLFAYLTPSVMRRLEAWISPDRDISFTLICHTFGVYHKKHFKKIYAQDIFRSPVYIYHFTHEAPHGEETENRPSP